MEKKIFLDDEVIAKIKNIQYKAKHLVSSSFAGEYQSAFKGRGMEFDEVREYSIGDDVRNIDWNVTARSTTPYVKVFKDERELTVIFMVDVSGSTHFGSKTKLKNEVAAEITGMLAYMALKNSDKVGLIIFSNDVEHYIPPKKGKEHIWRIIKDILTFKSKAKATNFKKSFDFLNKVIKRKTITFIISDFESENFEKELMITSKKHDVTAILISDQREREIPEIGFIELEDLETGQSVLVNSSSKDFQKQFKKIIEEEKALLESMFRRFGINMISIETEKSYIQPILDYFKKREKRR